MAKSHADAALALLIAVLCILALWRLAWWGWRLLRQGAGRLAKRFRGSSIWERLHPVQAALRRRAPRSYAFLRARLAPGRFDGLPLTLLVAAALYLASLLGGLIEDVVEAEEIVALDQAVNAFFAPWRSTFLLMLFIWITEFGANPALIAVVIVSTGFLWADRRASFILPLWVTILGANLTTWAGKYGFGRTRPAFETVATAFSPSFPSAHATAALAVYGFVAYAIARDATPRQRFEIAFWTLILIALIGFSRIFLSVHFLSDVAAGFLVGGFWLLVGFSLQEFQRQRLAAGRRELGKDLNA